ncbi:hypothetical protein LUR56_39780 [Streptomyces sp. MT29]|nr:hypothetical protein [Streptomyces sp. MT29]
MNPRLAIHRAPTAEEVLYVLNGQESVPLYRLRFLVITGTYTPHRLEQHRPWTFTPGAILVVDHTRDGTREFLGLGREPLAHWEDAHWCTHEATTLHEAQEVAAVVTSDRPRGYYTWTADGLTHMSHPTEGEELWASRQDGSVVRIADFTGRVA